MGKSAAIVRRLVLAAFLFAGPAGAQNLIGPDQDVGPVPGFGGTGLAGLYYDNEAGFSSANASPPEATFTASNLCFPDCQGGVFNDGNGGLAAFTNGNAFNIMSTGVVPLRTDWNFSEIDMSGYIAITTPGTYTFLAGNDDDFAITVGGVTTSFGCCGTNEAFTDTFTQAGLYRISTLFQEFQGGSYMSLSVLDPNNNCIIGCYDPNDNLEANNLFYSDTDLEGAPAPVIGGGWAAVAAAGLMGLEVMRRRRRAQPASRSHASAVPVARSSTFCTLPVGVLGSSLARISI
jgi:hypothetical protein